MKNWLLYRNMHASGFVMSRRKWWQLIHQITLSLWGRYGKIWVKYPYFQCCQNSLDLLGWEAEKRLNYKRLFTKRRLPSINTHTSLSLSLTLFLSLSFMKHILSCQIMANQDQNQQIQWSVPCKKSIRREFHFPKMPLDSQSLQP